MRSSTYQYLLVEAILAAHVLWLILRVTGLFAVMQSLNPSSNEPPPPFSIYAMLIISEGATTRTPDRHVLVTVYQITPRNEQYQCSTALGATANQCYCHCHCNCTHEVYWEFWRPTG